MIGLQEQLVNFLYSLLFFYTRFYIDILLIISAATDPVMSKRRRGQELFSREAVIARLKEKSDVRENINKVANYRSAKSLEIAQTLNGKDEIGEEAMVFILASKLTMKGLLTLAMQLTMFLCHIVKQATKTGKTTQT